MKVLLRGNNPEEVIPAAEKAGLKIVEKDPEIIVAYGGDGALLGAEREFPGIPKLPIRDKTAPLCPAHSSYDKLCDLLLKGRLAKSEIIKIAGVCKGTRLVGINDVFIHNSNPVSAIRYRVWIDDEPYGHEVVGDGVGVATAHGSTAYYRSITHSVFRTGIGLAFSNSTEVTNHLVLPEDAVVKIRIVRGPAVLVADNNPLVIELKEGDDAVISKIQEKAIVYGLDIFMCPKCRRFRHPGE